MAFNSTKTANFHIGDQQLEETTEYTYLGIKIQSTNDYLAKHEAAVVAKSSKLKGKVWHLARHSYNTYAVGRTLWKTTAVPAITYANDAVALGSAQLKLLDRHQTEIGRWLLGANCCAANTAVTGEMGWSTHEVREAKSKSHYLGRLAFLSSERYARRMYQHIRYRGIRTGWIRRITAIDSKFSAGTERHAASGEKQWTRTTRTEITARGTCLWQEAMKKKRSLARYREHKSAPAPYHHYRGDRASALLFQARTGALLTRKRRQELFGDDATCRLCGLGDEDINHIFGQCPRLQPSETAGRAIDEVLGLVKHPEHEQRQNTGPPQPLLRQREAELVEATKRHLARWEKCCRAAEESEARALRAPASQDGTEPAHLKNFH
ncbi:hypothetical protein ISCGN_003215 [Ixodes scapularis]